MQKRAVPLGLKSIYCHFARKEELPSLAILRRQFAKCKYSSWQVVLTITETRRRTRLSQKMGYFGRNFLPSPRTSIDSGNTWAMTSTFTAFNWWFLNNYRRVREKNGEQLDAWNEDATELTSCELSCPSKWAGLNLTFPQLLKNALLPTTILTTGWRL
jgi:hypothetical protein